MIDNTKSRLGLLGLKIKKNKLFLVFALGLILLFLTAFAFRSVAVSNNIDGSWPYSLSGLRHSSQRLGVDVFFTYGPLFNRLAPYPHPEDRADVFIISNLIFLYILVSSLVSLYLLLKHWVKNREQKIMAVLLFTSLLLFTFDIDSLFYLLLISTILVSRKEKSSSLWFLVISGVGLFSLYKLGFSISFLLIMPLLALRQDTKFGLIYLKRLLLMLVSYLVTYFAVTGNASLSILTYIKNGVINSLYYNEFMSLSPSMNRSILLMYLAILVFYIATVTSLFAIVVYKDMGIKKLLFSNKFLFCFVASLAVAFSFKQSVVRNDGHLLAFSPFVFIAFLIPLLLYVQVLKRSKFNIPKNYVVILIASLFVVSSIINIITITQLKVMPGFIARIKEYPSYIYENRLLPSEFNSKKNETYELAKKRESELENIINYLDENDVQAPIIFFGNTTTYGEILKFNGYDVLYLPFLQNYASYPPQLFDDQYVDFMEKNPDSLVLLEETEGSINERFVSYELNNYFQYISRNYTVVQKDKDRRQYLLKKFDSKREQCKTIGTYTTKEGEEINIDFREEDNNGYIKMIAKVNTPVTEDLLSFVFKKPIYSYKITSNEGGVMNWRTTETTLEHGVAVYPMYLNYHDYEDNADFDINNVVLSGGISKSDSVKLEFQSCSYDW